MAGSSVSVGDHTFVHEYCRSSSESNVIYSLLKIDQTLYRAYADSVIHRHYNAIACVSVYDAFHSNVFSKHAITVLCANT